MKQKSGVDYFVEGWKLIQRPGITRFVILPMLANIIVMSLLFWWLFSQFASFLDFSMSYIPNWLQWLSYIAVGLVILAMVIFFCYFFNIITNVIAAPFNGLLAEHVEAVLTNQPAPTSTVFSVIKDIPRILKREVFKIVYYWVWCVPIFFLSWLPLIGQTIGPIVWFLFTAWMINIQYADYAFDNHKVSFKRMRRMLAQHRTDNLVFGSLVSLFTVIPVLNLIIMPIAVCGSTAMWVDHYRMQVNREKLTYC